MNVRALVEFLLPRSHRAQVLGDLEERGFQWRDVASTIPSAWIAHLRRDWIAPVPNLSAASDETIRLRTEQLQSGRNFGLLVVWCALSGSAMRFIFPDLHGLIVIAPGVAVALVMMVFGLPSMDYSSLIPALRTPLKEYRAALHRKYSNSVGPFLFLLVVQHVLRGPNAVWWLPLMAPCIMVAVLLMLYRNSRIHREIENLTTSTKTVGML